MTKLLNNKKLHNKIIAQSLLLFFWFLLVCPIFILGQEQEKVKYWVFFNRKNTSALEKINKSILYQKHYVSDRSLARRQKVLPENRLILEEDLPVNKEYLSDLENHGFHPIVVSRWFNSVSLYLTSAERRWIEKLPYVSGIQTVMHFYKQFPESQPADASRTNMLKSFAGLDYGPSITQNSLMHVPEIHNLGITGKHVLIGMMDTGFNRNHEALVGVQVVAEWDFIKKDGNTANETGDPAGQEKHGSTTLGTIAGFKTGQLIGPAYEAQFALAKTEIEDREIAIEEDYWVSGIEWMDSLGVDVVSSSLGYAFGFQDRPDYLFSQMDGKTAITTRAAEEAVKRGMVVVNSMGNERQSFWRHLISPADGPHVIAVGAVDPTGWLASFSSPGPTADDRIKPDCVAMGEQVYGLRFNPFGQIIFNGYGYVSGTSYSCPLTAGVVGLILSAHPDLIPSQVMEAIHQTSDRARQPDNDYGYGLVNAYKALLYHGAAFSNEPTVEENGTNYRVTISAAASSGIPQNNVRVYHRFSGVDHGFTSVVMSPGSSPNTFGGQIPAVSLLHDSVLFYFTVTDSSGRISRWPSGDETFSKPLIVRIPEQFSLLQNFPNPFNEETRITVLLPEETFITLKIYNILGQEVRMLFAQRLTAGRHFFNWDGRNAKGDKVATGVYIYRIHTSKFSEAKKMLFLK